MTSIRRFAAALLVLAALPMLQLRADRVDAFVPSGKTAPVTVTAAGDVATAAFVVQDGPGKKVTISVKPAPKSPLVPDVRLVAPDGTSYDTAAIATLGGKVKATKTNQVSVSLPNVPEGKGGLWRVEVRGAGDTSGGATVQFKAKDTTKLVSKSETIPFGSTLSKTIDVGSGQALTLSVRRGKGSKVVPKLQILDPNGEPVAGGQFIAVGNSKSGVLTLKKFRLPVFGTYTLVLTSDVGGGSVSISASTAPAKAGKTGPTADAGAPTEAEPTTVKVLDGSASRPGSNGSLAYAWSQIAGPAVVLNDASTSSPNFTAPSAATALAFELSVQENGVWSAPAPVSVEVGKRPISYAGRSQAVALSAAVTLDGTKSQDRRGKGLAYAWRQDPDDPVKVTLTGPATAMPTFNAPATDTVLHFGLTVDDGSLRGSEDWVTVRAGAGSITPDAGRDQFVPRMATVHLSALASISASGVLDGPVQWTKVSGPDVELSDPASLFPAFQAPKQTADLLFRLTAGGATDEVWVHVRPTETNLAPLTLTTGAQAAASGIVTLNAGPSGDPNFGDVLRFVWAQTQGAGLPLSATEVAAPTVDLPAGNEIRRYGVQTFDGLAYGAPDSVVVRNNPYSGEPVAYAGADVTLITPNQTVFLNGSGSYRTAGTGPLTYRWRQVSSKDWYDIAARIPSFNPAASNPTFNVLTSVSSLTPRRTITLELVVNDGVLDSAPDYVTVTFNNLPLNGKPEVIATATPNNPIAGGTVNLTATPSDGDNDPVTVRWQQTSPAPFVTFIGGSTSYTPSFVAPASGTLTFKVTPNDGFEDGVPATVSVTVDAAPTARLSVSPPNGGAGTQITIDGTASSDPTGQALTFKLTQVSGAAVALTPSPTIPGIWQATPANAASWQLVVNDGRQDSAAVTASFSTGTPVSASPTATPNNAPYTGTVTLSANAAGTGPYTYLWSQVTTGANSGDPKVTISNATAASPTFTVPKPTSSTGFGSSPSVTLQVDVTGGPAGGTTQASATVKVTFFASLNDKAGAGLKSADTVYGLLNGKYSCAQSGCHGTATKGCSTSIGYQWTGGSTGFLQVHNNITSCASSKVRVAPNNSGNSYLIDRLKGTGGTQMPQFATPLSAAEISLVADWIDQGAQDN